MPAKRPTPLSDEMFHPVLLGSTNFGMPLRVKNTFVDFGVTPSSMRHTRPEPSLTAPASSQKCVTLSPHESFLCLLATGTSPLDAHVLLSPYVTASAAELAPALELGTYAELAAARLIEEDTASQAGSPSSSAKGEEEDDEADSDSEVEAAAAHPGISRAVPAAPPGVLHPSLGSEGHALGTCTPCCFFPRGRCANGYACMFCHYDHEKRKRKSKRGVRSAARSAAASATATAGTARCGAWGPSRAAAGPRAARALPPTALRATQGNGTVNWALRPQGMEGMSQPLLYGCPPGGSFTPQPYFVGHSMPVGCSFATPSSAPCPPSYPHGTVHFAVQPTYVGPAAMQVHSLAPQARSSPNVLDLLGCPALSFAVPAPRTAPKLPNMRMP